MFDLPVLHAGRQPRAPASASGSARSSPPSGWSPPFSAACASAPTRCAWTVGLYITAAYWFTTSTSFANPAVTLARALSDSFAGIAPADVPAFVAAQLVGALLAAGLFGWLFMLRAPEPVPQAALDPTAGAGDRLASGPQSS